MWRTFKESSRNWIWDLLLGWLNQLIFFLHFNILLEFSVFLDSIICCGIFSKQSETLTVSFELNELWFSAQVLKHLTFPDNLDRNGFFVHQSMQEGTHAVLHYLQRAWHFAFFLRNWINIFIFCSKLFSFGQIKLYCYFQLNLVCGVN